MKTSEELSKKVDLFREGDQNAFTDVYEASYRYLHTCVIHIVRDEDIAQDMLQDTYVEICRNIGQLKSSADFLSWAATIANRKCFAYLRKDRDMLVDPKEDEEGNEAGFFENIADDEAFIPENIFDDRAKIEIIRGIIDDLSDLQRACVIGFYYNEQKQDEIASELGIPVNTVKSHLNRAKAKIKDAVGDVEKKQDTKLYSIAPFLLLFFLDEAGSFAAKETVPAMSSALRDAAAAGREIAAQSASKTAGSAAGKTAMSAVKARIAIGAAIVAVGAASVGGIAYFRSHQTPGPATEASQTVEEAVAETEPAEAEPAEPGPTPEEPEAQANEALTEDYRNRIDECISSEDYDTAYALINEANEKLGTGDFDSRLSELPYAVANGVDFTTIGDLDSFAWLTYAERRGDDIYRVTGDGFDFSGENNHISGLTIDEKETEDGLKEYVVSCTMDISYTASYPIEAEPATWVYAFDELRFFDYYTGLILNTADVAFLNGERERDGTKDNVVTWNGTEYPVEIYVEKTLNNDGDSSWDDQTVTETWTEQNAYTFTIRCPKDYDGLCMFLMNPAEVNDTAEENRWNHLFDDTGLLIEDQEEMHSGIKYMFQDPDFDGEVHTPDFYLMMRVQ